MTSTTYPQIKHILNSAYDASVSYITGGGLGLIVDAITRVDQEYIRDQMWGAEDDEEDLGDDSDVEENGNMAEEDDE